jgi:endonuclease YncB( thermonuclease family)
MPRARRRSPPEGLAAMTQSRSARGVFACAVLAVAVFAVPARADFTGKVVAVADGDTVTILVERREVRVRLSGIDAPEHGQPHARAARQSLASLVAGRTVAVHGRGQDGYGRVLGELRVDALDVNAEQVRRGYAWVFRRYSLDPYLLALEAEAKAARRGLWQDPDPVAPWLWREQPAPRQGAADPPALQAWKRIDATAARA